MRRLCLLLTALSVAGSPALAQPSTPSSAENKAEKPATKRVCKRVADVNSLVARKVCREVPLEAATTKPAKQVADQPGGSAQGGSE